MKSRSETRALAQCPGCAIEAIDDELVVYSSQLSLRVSKSSGTVLVLASNAPGLFLGELSIGFSPKEIDRSMRIHGGATPMVSAFVGFTATSDLAARSVTLRIAHRLNVDEYETSVRYTLFAESARFEKQISVRRLKQTALGQCLGFRFEVARPQVGDPRSCRVITPGPWPPNKSQLPETSFEHMAQRGGSFPESPDIGFGAIVVTNNESNQSLITWVDALGKGQSVPSIVQTNGSYDIEFNQEQGETIPTGNWTHSGVLHIHWVHGDRNKAYS
jgi:hypothetical protein